MGQPMSSSYENRWLSAGEDKKGRRKSVTNEEKTPTTPKEKGKKKENTRPQQQGGEAPKKSQKEMTKAERRELQERQRQEKANRIAAGLPKSAKQAAELEAKKGPSSSTTQPDHVDTNKQQQSKKKAVSKNQNQVPWLAHLEAPKTNDALTKDLHPAVLQLGLYFSEHKIVGSNARCVAMLEIFSKVKVKKKKRNSLTLQNSFFYL